MTNKKSFRKYAVSTMAAATAAATVVPAAVSADTQSGFPDVSDNNDHKEAIAQLVDEGVIKGYADGTFGPYDHVYRGQVAVMLYEKLGLNVPKDVASALKDYKDIDATHRYASQIAAVTEAGIFSGKGDTFQAYTDISRQQMATALVEGFGLEKYNTEEDVEIDLSKVSVDHQKNVQILANLGITTQLGDEEDNNYEGYKPVTRAQFATFLVQASNVVAPKIVDLESPAEITVDKGGELELPETVKATYENDTTKDVAVEWDTDEVDVNTVGTYEVPGTVEGTDQTVTAKVVVRAIDVVVEDVSAINASEIEVTYNTDVEKESAGDEGNYDVKVNENTNNIVEDVKVSGNKVILRLGTALNPSDQFAVQVKDAVRSTDGKKLEKYASPTQTFGQVTAPKLENAGWDGDNLQLTFDKPVDKNSASVIKIDGTSLADSDLDFTGDNANEDKAGNYTYTAKLTSDEKKLASKEGNRKVTLFDVAETSTAKPAVASTLSAEYAVKKDTSAPAVKGIEALNANKFFIETNKAVDLDGEDSLEVRKGNHLFETKKVDGTNTSDNSSVYAEKGTLDGKKGYFVVVTDESANGDKNPLYAKGESSVELDVTVKGYKDSDKLVGKAYNGSVTLEKSADKPVIDKSSIDSSDDKKVYLDFKQELEQTSTINSDRFVVRDKDGVIVPEGKYTATVTNDADGNTDRRVELNFTDGTDNIEPVTIEVKANTLNYKGSGDTNPEDYQVKGQKNDKLTTTVKAKDKDNFKFISPTSAAADANNVITVNYGEKMTDSALNVANYTLDGDALPEGTTIDFYENKEQVKINLPKEFVEKNDTKFKFAINTDVETQDGRHVVNNAVDQDAYSKTIELQDNVSPEVESKAVYLVNDENDKDHADTIKLTFSEAVNVVGDATGGDAKVLDNFTVIVNGQDQTVTAVQDSSVATGIEDDELVLKLDNEVNTSQKATITIVPDSEGKIHVEDANGNTLLQGEATVSENGTVVDSDNADPSQAADAAYEAQVAQAEEAAAALLNEDKDALAEDVDQDAIDAAQALVDELETEDQSTAQADIDAAQGFLDA